MKIIDEEHESQIYVNLIVWAGFFLEVGGDIGKVRKLGLHKEGRGSIDSKKINFSFRSINSQPTIAFLTLFATNLC